MYLNSYAKMGQLSSHGNKSNDDENNRDRDGGGNIGRDDRPSTDPDLLEKKSKLRRAFSMPRNPFRLSRRIKIIDTIKDSYGPNGILAVNSHCLSNKDSVHVNVNIVDKNCEKLDTGTDKPCVVSSQPSQLQPQQPSNGTHFNSQHCDNKQSTVQPQPQKIFRRSSWKKFVARIAQQMTTVNIGAKQTALTDRVPPLSSHVFQSDQIPGVTGLRNHGNTCFMNAVLQCLSHTDILAEYFVLDQYKADLKRRNKINSRKFGTKGEITEQLAVVLKALWTCKNESDYSTQFKAVVDRYGTQFRSSTQHDAQEFLFWLLDKVHEDLNTASKRKYKSIRNNYGRPDEIIAAETLANHIRCNNSFVQAVFQAQFRSSLSCPRCHKQSNTFDPFHCISVQLPQLLQQPIFVTVVYATQHPRQVKLGIGVPHGSPMIALREQLHADTGIPSDRMVLAEISDIGFTRIFADSYPMLSICKTDSIYCIETLDVKNEQQSTNLLLLITNVFRIPGADSDSCKRFGTPFCVQVNRDISYMDLQKKLLKEMQSSLKSEVFAYATSPVDMFKIRLQDPSADPDTYIDCGVEHPLFMEMIDLALSVLPSDVGPVHIKLLLEWTEPERYFGDMSDSFVEHESVAQMEEKFDANAILTLEQCLEHYTKAETLSAEDAWRCPNCQKYLPVVKTLGLWSLPDILVIHFKRFRQQHIKGPQAAKLTTTVKFPLTGFDMSPHLARGNPDSSLSTLIRPNEDGWSPRKRLKRKSNCITDSLQRDNRYDLYAVCYHQGDTLETGHYTAACKNPYDHQWYKFDDQRVSQVAGDRISDEIVNNEAYMLFYQRRKFDNLECSGSSSTSVNHWASKIACASNGLQGSACIIPATNSMFIKNLVQEENIRDKGVIIDDIEAKYERLEIIENISEATASNEKDPQSISKTIDVEINTNPTLLIDERALIKSNVSDDIVIKIEPTNEDEVVDVDGSDSDEMLGVVHIPEIKIIDRSIKLEVSDEFLIDDDIQLRCDPVRLAKEKLSTSVPTQRSLWPTVEEISANNNRGSLNLNEIFSSSFRRDRDLHSLSLTGYQRRNIDNDTIRLIRGSSSCSKDTLLFADQQNRQMIEESSEFLENQSIWISPLTPPKLITVSPKN